ncbi:hypothetical protein DFH08DRAFT_1024008 [Mycena albidolilacea]|uniref:SMP-30/Gluconolactonase/LRE-like region domain-containing protein n=1 Tax=Mycena albidolilacea TaxID=1033008 RepID=A0AAD6ZMB2_9AGAR|nr:hypothetical protein DFH08DRAFT_1024008 [Mycena albidolilacea]
MCGDEEDDGNRSIEAPFSVGVPDAPAASPIGLFLENIAVRPSSGKLLLTSVLSPTLYTLDPTAANATLDEVYTFPNATALAGITESSPSGASTLPPALPFPESLPASHRALTNGLSATPGRLDIVLAADSAPGAAYEVDMRTGAVRVLIEDAALAPGAPPPVFGVNCLHPHRGSLYFTNAALNTFGRVPLGGDGGAPEVLVATGSGYDDFAFDTQGRAWVATHPGSVLLFYAQEWDVGARNCGGGCGGEHDSSTTLASPATVHIIPTSRKPPPPTHSNWIPTVYALLSLPICANN